MNVLNAASAVIIQFKKAYYRKGIFLIYKLDVYSDWLIIFLLGLVKHCLATLENSVGLGPARASPRAFFTARPETGPGWAVKNPARAGLARSRAGLASGRGL